MLYNSHKLILVKAIRAIDTGLDMMMIRLLKKYSELTADVELPDRTGLTGFYNKKNC